MVTRYHVYLISLLAALAIIQEIQAVEYEVFNYAARTSGGEIFKKELSKQAVKLLELATNHIRNIFGQTKSSDDRVQVKKIYLRIDTMRENSTSELKDQIGRIYINADHIASSEQKEVGSDFLDLIYYEMTHILQWRAGGNIPDTIKDGIAAFIVLDSGTGKPRGSVEYGQGDSWDESPYVTGRFFQYCTYHLCSGFVTKLNNKLKHSYDENYFVELTKKTISVAWKEYKDKYTKRAW